MLPGNRDCSETSWPLTSRSWSEAAVRMAWWGGSEWWEGGMLLPHHISWRYISRRKLRQTAGAETALKSTRNFLISLSPRCSDKSTVFLVCFSGVKRGRWKTSWQRRKQPGWQEYWEHENLIWAIKLPNHGLCLYEGHEGASLMHGVPDTGVNGDRTGWVIQNWLYLEWICHIALLLTSWNRCKLYIQYMCVCGLSGH